MSAPQPVDEPVPYSEREAALAEADRGKVLDALAGQAFWVLITATVDSDGIKLKLESGDGLDTDDIKALLRKTLAAIP